MVMEFAVVTCRQATTGSVLKRGDTPLSAYW
jgi:hypothetical protein